MKSYISSGRYGPSDTSILPNSINVVEGNQVICPYVKTKNEYANTPLPQPSTLSGRPVSEVCLPVLSGQTKIDNWVNNTRENNKPVHHLSFNKTTDCYSDNICSKKMNKSILY